MNKNQPQIEPLEEALLEAFQQWEVPEPSGAFDGNLLRAVRLLDFNQPQEAQAYLRQQFFGRYAVITACITAAFVAFTSFHELPTNEELAGALAWSPSGFSLSFVGEV